MSPYRCEGHHLYIEIPNQKTLIVACEGLHHLFARWTKTFPTTGANVSHFVGTGCLGTGSTIAKHQSQQQALGKPTSQEDLVALGVTSSKILSMPCELNVEDLSLPSSGLGAWGVQMETRCNGHSGEVHKVKWGSSTSSILQEGDKLFDYLKGEHAKYGTLSISPYH